ncbi:MULTISPECIES: hypothetical protein [Klebsiella pneumoniae complex]|uniref:hypothetical protein n=1 Tax=Klebsiella pneumoniae complex TaxID=3390273 RepID=UPI00117F5733|nr:MULTISPECIES: hypothetical protein [Klebsiella]HBZ8007266.1 hypothetical protein [Klebsiella variicola subsp. variicola]MDT9748341.1 hypothetical protein [Klebsiella variicola]MDT9762093.1 hypothetical protein [Klebsiella variicola]QWS98791.1 hypothetical protein FOH49_015940 [Klebsiella pneumoniae]QWT03865.1 hypothetical protein FOH48_015905 [Klebsiella pneumoniae]
MTFIPTWYLKEVVLFVDADETQYKYELFQKSDGSGFFANLFRLDDFMDLQLWVKIDELNHLLSYVKEHAVEEVEEHFKKNFFTS